MYKLRIINLALLTFATMLAVAWSENATAGKIDVHGDSATYSADGSRAEFNGNVIIRTISVTVHAQQLIVSVLTNGNHYLARGTPATAVCLSCAHIPIHLSAGHISLHENNQIYLLNGGITLCAGEGDCQRGKLQADNAEWQRENGKVQLRGAIRGYWRLQEEDTAITFRAEQADYDSTNGEVKLSGDALLAREGDEIRGDTVIFNTKTGALSADSGGDKESGEGRVRGVFGTDE